MDVRKTVTDAGYIAIGLGVMGYQQAPDPAPRAQRKLDAVPARVADRGREVQGFLAEGTRQIGARGTAARGQRRGAGAHRRSAGCRSRRRGRQAGRARRRAGAGQLGELPERVVQVIEPVAARVRELHRHRGLSPDSRNRTTEHGPGRTFRACSLPLPAVSAPPVSSPGSCAPCRRATSSPIVNTGRRRRVPRPLRLPRPRLGHLHARRRVERRAGLGPRGRDLRHARRARALRRPHLVPARRQGPRHPPLPHAAAARGRDALRGDGRDRRGPGASASGCCR